jgi:hypothetical protein
VSFLFGLWFIYDNIGVNLHLYRFDFQELLNNLFIAKMIFSSSQSGGSGHHILKRSKPPTLPSQEHFFFEGCEDQDKVKGRGKDYLIPIFLSAIYFVL